MFRKLLTFDEAKKVIETQFKAKPLGVEETSLLGSFSRVLAENITADIDIPPFNRSTVDGFAVRAEDTFGAEENSPVELHVSGIVNIGELPETVVRKGGTAEIVTGAPMPKGADAVVMMEYTRRRGDRIDIFSSVARNENMMKAGSDIKKDATILRKGQLLGSRQIGVLAAIGRKKAKVYQLPKVAVLSTGPEVTEPGDRLPPGKIYDINAYTLCAAVLESGGTPLYLGVFPDRQDDLHEALLRALACSDIVVTSGGVSVGPKDIMPKTVKALGEPGIIVSGIALKPGKPTTVASIDGKPVFSLPGHPASALLTYMLFARPLVQAMGGRSCKEPQEVKATASTRMFPAKGRRTFVMVTLKQKKTKGLVAEPLPAALSGAITTLTMADGFVEIGENVQFIEAGDPVTVKLFENETIY